MALNEDETVSEMLERNGDERGPNATRRRALIGGLGLVSAGALGTIAIPGSAAAEVSTESLTASGYEITSHDGTIDEISVDPVLAIEWEGFNHGADVTIDVTFRTDGESDVTPYEETEHLSATNGETEVDYEETDLLAEGWSAGTFESEGDGETTETTVTAVLDWEIAEMDLDGTESDEFTVVVHNHPARASAGGEIETDVESDEEV